MPRRDDIRSILVIGSGPIVIGQACEFDYSGTQALKALRREGYRLVLLNNNPATIMTDPGLSDRTYLEPMTVESAEKIIARERPDAVLPTMGGQTALNLAMALADQGILARYGVELIGASRDVINRAEDRLAFKETMARVGLELPRSTIAHSVEEAVSFAEATGLPLISRPSFTLGGEGGGIANTMSELRDLVAWGLRQSPNHEILVEESLLGWKEFELEIMRDHADNFVVICSIENIDPMGTHTGDSVTVAPAQTLTDRELQAMRDEAAACARAVGVSTGGANIQFAVNPDTGRRLVIEMNPRVSRSSALASKATGFPIAKIAALLAVGYTLDEVKNDITGITPASFEPSLDYVAVKIPRFNFDKFPDTPAVLGSQMRSVGESMGLGRTFKEAFQKALRSLDTKWHGFRGTAPRGASGNGKGGPGADASTDDLLATLRELRPDKLELVYRALRAGIAVGDVASASAYDPWFVRELAEIVALEKEIEAAGADLPTPLLEKAKSWGFSDRQLGQIIGKRRGEVAQLRMAAGIEVAFRSVDTCAAEFPAQTPYLYSSYDRPKIYRARLDTSALELVSDGTGDVARLAGDSVLILGAGPNRIGQGLEFDYCCVHAVNALRQEGYKTLMLNCNPETVSTDYETCDRLYFEPLTVEDVLNVWRAELPRGVVLQFGGQTPLSLAEELHREGVTILGTSLDSIDRAEDRDRFERLIRKLGLRYPASGVARTIEEARAVAADLGFPLLLRPSFVLGGRAMQVVFDDTAFDRILEEVTAVTPDHPVILDKYLDQSVEIDVDAVADGVEVVVAGIMEHIEEAGIHSGDSVCVLPPYTIRDAIVAEIVEQTVAIARELQIVGLLNIQFAVREEKVYVLEVNPRASRTVPFVSKATGVAWADVAARCLVGRRLAELVPQSIRDAHGCSARGMWAVKGPVFPFNRFPGVDTVLGPEMRSTGETIGLDHEFPLAFSKAQTHGRFALPTSGTVFFSLRDEDKKAAVFLARKLYELGFAIRATRHTARVLREAGVPVQPVLKVSEGRPHGVDMMNEGQIQLVINTPGGRRSRLDSRDLRRTALLKDIPYFTTLQGASAAIGAIEALRQGKYSVCALQELAPIPAV
ncbi:MAG: carbamoyl-phosphate synthase large subunit [Candidatus Schekmanbacteria bacterium]|nr:carbamoyl-phosphate synthase large subunit [Candidatus Schekmanbacteria bacterium]